MANSLTAASPTYWSGAMQDKFYKEVVFPSIASFTEQSLLKTDGRIVEKPYRSALVAENYTKGTAATAQDLTATSDQLTLDQFWDILMYVDAIDKIQNKYDAVKAWGEEMGARFAQVLDADVLYEAINANNTVDASDIGGTSGEGITVNTTNPINIIAEINEYLNSKNIPQSEKFFAMDSIFYSKLWMFLAGRESQFGDKTGETGNVGSYGGMQLYMSNNMTGEARWTPADNPSDEATIVIEGITFTFQSVIGTTAGNILQTTNLATTIDNLVALINAGGVGDEVNYVSLSTANKRAVSKWLAVDGTTYVIVRVKGTSKLTCTSSESADTWDAKWCYSNLLAGRKKSIDVAIQTGQLGMARNPFDVEMASTVSAGKKGTNVMGLMVYGKKTFYQNLDALVRVKVRIDS